MGLVIRELNKNYGDVQALRKINITFENGIYGLLGPNGAGKSTLMNLLTDNLHRESGEILWDGEDILSLGKRYRNILGYMPQQQGYYEDFSVGAFLMYMAKLKGMGKKDAKQRTLELLPVVNLEKQRKQRIGGLSGGMKQRLLLAQALLNNPKLLILDEPTAGVDPQERIRIRNFISEIAKDRIVIIATHIVSDVESIAKKVILMKQGEIIDNASPFELLDKIKNYVYEIKIEERQLQQIQQCYVVSNLRYTTDGLVVKIITKKEPAELEYKRAPANLEDVYLFHFDENFEHADIL